MSLSNDVECYHIPREYILVPERKTTSGPWCSDKSSCMNSGVMCFSEMKIGFVHENRLESEK